MKHIVAATAVSFTFLLGQGAQAQEQNGGFYAGSVGPNAKPEGFIELAIGENAGRFRLVHKVLRCNGLLRKSEASKNWVSVPDPQSCPESFLMNVELADSVASIDVSAGNKSAEFSAERILPLSVTSEAKSPANLDVLGLEVGMSKEDVIQILINERGYSESPADKNYPANGAFILSNLSWFSTRPDGQSYTLPTTNLDLIQQGSMRDALENNPRIEGMQFVLDEANPGDERISVGFLDNRVFAVFRQLSVDKNSLDAVYAAMNEKYGSFEKGTYAGRGDLGDVAYSEFFMGADPNRGAQVFGGSREGRWGASSYRSDATLIDQKLIANLHREPNIKDGCMISFRFDAVDVVFANKVSLPIPSNCATDAFFGIREQNRSDKDKAFIAIYQAFGVLDAHFEATLAFHEDNWLDELQKIQNDAETQVETIVPEL